MRKADLLIGFLIAAVVLAGIYYGIRSYENIQNQNPDRPSVAETLNEIGNGKTATLEEEDAYDEEEYEEDLDTTSYQPERPTIDDLADLNKQRAQEEVVPPSYNGNTNAGTTTNTSTRSEGNKSFLVVAGTFKQMANAEIMLKKFRHMGYVDAEIGKFNKSAYASLIVDRFATSAEAKRFAKTLSSKHKVEAYVHRKR